MPRRREWVWDILGALICTGGVLIWWLFFHLLIP
jgi:hypothetical protein